MTRPADKPLCAGPIPDRLVSLGFDANITCALLAGHADPTHDDGNGLSWQGPPLPPGTPAVVQPEELLDAVRTRFAKSIKPNMLFALEDAELYGEPGKQRISEWADWIETEVLAALRECVAGPGPRANERSYAEMVNAPLTLPEIEALNKALVSGDYPRYRRATEKGGDDV